MGTREVLKSGNGNFISRKLATVSKMVFQRGTHRGIHSHMVGSSDRSAFREELSSVEVILLDCIIVSNIGVAVTKHCEVFFFVFFFFFPIGRNPISKDLIILPILSWLWN